MGFGCHFPIPSSSHQAITLSQLDQIYQRTSIKLQQKAGFVGTHRFVAKKHAIGYFLITFSPCQLL